MRSHSAEFRQRICHSETAEGIAEDDAAARIACESTAQRATSNRGMDTWVRCASAHLRDSAINAGQAVRAVRTAGGDTEASPPLSRVEALDCHARDSHWD